MTALTTQEQYMLELINRARMDPAGEAKRQGIALNEGVGKHDRISTAPKEVLAGNLYLNNAADNHTSWMLRNNMFSHDEKPGTAGFTYKSFDTRITKAGYSGWSAIGENISWRPQTAKLTDEKLLDAQFKDLFVDHGVEGRGHRVNILSDAYREVGIGQAFGDFKSGGKTYHNASMMTQDFGKAGNAVFITGVVYNDTDFDHAYSLYEGVSGMLITSDIAPGDTTGAGNGGGYAISLFANAQTQLTFTGPMGVGDTVVRVNVVKSNIKLDQVNGDELWTDSSISVVSGPIDELHALGIRKVNLTGASAGEKIYGNDAANVLTGNAGADTLDGGKGKDQLVGGADADTFVFSKGDTGKTAATADVITDFSQADGDKIDLSDWDANSVLKGAQDFTFIDTAAFGKHAGELRYFISNGVTWVQGDTDGDGKADMLIRIEGSVTLTSADFDL